VWGENGAAVVEKGKGKMFHKSKANFVIDTLMFLCGISIVGIGFLMKYSLIPGKDRLVKYGRNVDLLLFKLDRHEWGTIHLVIGFIFLGLLVLHIILHWKMIVNMYHRLIGSRIARRRITSIFMIVCVIWLIFSLMVKPEVIELRREEGRHEAGLAYVEETRSSIEVKGYMMLIDVAEKYNVPIDDLKKHIGIPQSTSSKAKLGQLRQRYDFRMSDVEKIISEYRKSRSE